MNFFFVLSIFLLTFILLAPNIMHGLLGLILLFGNFALLLFLLDLPFLGFSYIIVYIGAICVLFLYIILLLNLRIFPLAMRSSFYVAMIFGILFFSFFFLMIISTKNLNLFSSLFTFLSIEDLSLYTQYLFEVYPLYLLMAVFLLLVALIIALTTTYSITSNNEGKKVTKILYHEKF